MKTLNDYLALSYRMEIIRDNDEGGFVASYPDLPGCITCGETEEEALKNALDAKKAWLEAALEENIFTIVSGTSWAGNPTAPVSLPSCPPSISRNPDARRRILLIFQIKAEEWS